MKKTLLRQSFLFALLLFLTNSAIAQTTSITVFDEILFYDGYAGLVDEQDLYEPIPPEVLRHSNSNYAIKLTEAQLDAMGNKLTMDITLKAACDNYDRIARVYLAFVDKGQTTYNQSDVDRIEIGRFITPFMNKNIQPDEVPFEYTMDNVAEIFNDQNLRSQFDIWVELDIFGVPYAAQQQVAGCEGRIDTFYGTLIFNSEEDSSQTYPDDNFIKTLACNERLNNYNATDVPGETTKIIDFELTETVENLKLYVITSNHGANQGGEEYNRREHFIYLDNNLIHDYIPGGKSCEPFRQYNTQGNGIYSGSPRSTRTWLDFNNWCPADVIPNREINLGTLTAGQHTIKLDVPDAVFVNDEGYIPVSMYLQNRNSEQEVCIVPTDLTGSDETEESIYVDWVENGTAEEWEVMYGRYANLNDETVVNVNGETGVTITDLLENKYYSLYVRSICDSDNNSVWVGPVLKQTLLDINSNEISGFEYYPNPVTNSLIIKAPNTIDTITIIDALGKKVLHKNINSLSSEVDLNTISSGLYFMKVSVNGKSNAYKLLKN